MMISVRSQVMILWLALVLATIFGIALGFLLHMIPPPGADASADEVRRWYLDKGSDIRIGATVSSFTSAFLLPLWVVIGVQMSRQETGKPVWSVLAVAGGATAAIPLALPGIFFGVAAFTPERDAQVTQLMHELGVLSLVTPTQFFIFSWIGLIAVCLLPQPAPHSPFPRWFGYFNICFAFIFELGALAFNWKTGPFSWNGIFTFWAPFGLFALWLGPMYWLLLRALKQQRAAADGPLTDR